MNDPLILLADRFRSGIKAAFPTLEGDPDPLIAPSKVPGIDFQCNAAMALGKRLGLSPRQAAAQIVTKVDLSPVGEPLSESAIAGPGFINIRLRPAALGQLAASMDTPALGVEPPKTPETVVVDLCGVNLAKQMHVGHLRATIIGDALARVFTRLGHTAKRQNHVGDWGLPIAMVTDRLMKLSAAGAINLDTLTLDDLDEAYRAAKQDCDADESGLDAVRRFGLGPKAAAELEAQVSGALAAEQSAKRTLVNLQSHEPKTYAVWKRIADITMAECILAFSRLKVNLTHEHSAGESSYSEELAGVVQDLLDRRIAEVSEGAVVVRVEGIAEPCIIRKRDGGFIYATTDMAAIRRRVQMLGADRVVYCVDARQSLHFKQVFGAAVKAGYATRPGHAHPALLQHAAFGTVMGEDGKPFKSRSGDNIKLMSLIDEAAERSLAAVRERAPEASPQDQATIAEAVAVAAIKFADLANDRARDYVFSFDRMLAFEGCTGPYLLYALVRVRSIFRKAAERGMDSDITSMNEQPPSVSAPQEKALVLALVRYHTVLAQTAEALEPHRLCQYLYELAGAFSTFFDACPVLAAPDQTTRRSRLRLCDLTGRVLADGLQCLGIPPLDRM